jgi:hypothetical protein
VRRQAYSRGALLRNICDANFIYEALTRALILLKGVRPKCVQDQILKETLIMSGAESVLMPFMVTLAIGLGLERERRKGRSTFAVASLLGAISVRIGGTVLLSVAAAGLIGLAAFGYVRDCDDDPGLATEIALALTLALGGLAAREPAMAAALSVVVASLLAGLAPLHRFVRDASEIRDGLNILHFSGDSCN